MYASLCKAQFTSPDPTRRDSFVASGRAVWIGHICLSVPVLCISCGLTVHESAVYSDSSVCRHRGLQTTNNVHWRLFINRNGAYKYKIKFSFRLFVRTVIGLKFYDYTREHGAVIGATTDETLNGTIRGVDADPRSSLSLWIFLSPLLALFDLY